MRSESPGHRGSPSGGKAFRRSRTADSAPSSGWGVRMPLPPAKSPLPEGETQQQGRTARLPWQTGTALPCQDCQHDGLDRCTLRVVLPGQMQDRTYEKGAPHCDWWRNGPRSRRRCASDLRAASRFGADALSTWEFLGRKWRRPAPHRQRACPASHRQKVSREPA